MGLRIKREFKNIKKAVETGLKICLYIYNAADIFLNKLCGFMLKKNLKNF